MALLNGLAMSTRAWYGFLPLLADEYDVLLYDYLGQGESSKPDEPYSITRIAQYLTAIMDELGDRRRCTRWGSPTAASSPSSTPASSTNGCTR